jgi:aarF domain-containing kinase
MLDHVIPSEYQETLSTLLANTPTSTIESVRRVIYEDLGKYPEELFFKFDPVPIASASLAQVHVAYDKEGNKYAVKVQHEGLREGSVGDMIAITFLVHFISNIFEGFSYKWLGSEMNENLPKELDFQQEMSNLEKCRILLSNLIATGDVAIPIAYKDKTSSRVLTMKFEEGSYVTDLDAIHKLNLNPAHVARLISLTFCEQIFRHGFVHCDPHEGNLLVRENPLKKGRPQIVLLDHGLYKDMGESLRKNYCRLWRALVTGDEPTIKEQCQNLNAGKAFTLLAAMLTMRPWDDIVSDDMGRLKSKNTKGEQEMLKAYARY